MLRPKSSFPTVALKSTPPELEMIIEEDSRPGICRRRFHELSWLHDHASLILGPLRYLVSVRNGILREVPDLADDLGQVLPILRWGQLEYAVPPAHICQR